MNKAIKKTLSATLAGIIIASGMVGVVDTPVSNESGITASAYNNKVKSGYISGFTVSTPGKNWAVLKWNTTGSVTGLKLYYGTKNNKSQMQSISLKSDQKVYTVKNLKPGKKYYFRLEYYSNSGGYVSSRNLNTSCYTMLDDCKNLKLSYTKKKSGKNIGTIQVRWGGPSNFAGLDTGYEVSCDYVIYGQSTVRHMKVGNIYAGANGKAASNQKINIQKPGNYFIKVRAFKSTSAKNGNLIYSKWTATKKITVLPDGMIVPF